MKASLYAVQAIAFLSIAVVPASADLDLYSNGPVNGTFLAWEITEGFIVSDSFVLSNPATITGVDFGAWVFLGQSGQGGNLTSVQWSIGTNPEGNDSGEGVAATTGVFFGTRPGTIFGTATIDTETFAIPNISLGPGTYYLTLQNATTTTGNPIAFWDVNNGPSSGFLDVGNGPVPLAGYDPFATGCGSVSCSESFDIRGTTNAAATPEPGYWALLSAAIIGLVWMKLRRPRAEP